MVASVAVLAVAAAIGGGGPVDVTCHRAAELSAIAAGFGHDESDRVVALGSIGEPRVWLRRSTCRVLTEVSEGRHRGMWDWQRVGWHTLVLGHELAHNAGIGVTPETHSEADCAGAAWSKRIARALGHPRPYRVRDWAVWWSSCERLK